MKAKLLISTLILSVLSSVLISNAPVFAEDDDHYIDAEHYFITKEKFKQGWMYVTLATMKTPATAQTKGEAEFTAIKDGEEIWTKFYYKTRVLKKEEIKNGIEVIMCEIGEDETYRAPADKDEALQGTWFMAKITDTSDMYKGYVTVSGGFKIRLDNMRIIVK